MDWLIAIKLYLVLVLIKCMLSYSGAYYAYTSLVKLGFKRPLLALLLYCIVLLPLMLFIMTPAMLYKQGLNFFLLDKPEDITNTIINSIAKK